jgi:hypothetical protein
MDIIQLAQALDGLPLHALLLIAVVVLWRDNKALRDKLDSLNQKADDNANQMLHQTTVIGQIAQQQTNPTTTRQYPPQKR